MAARGVGAAVVAGRQADGAAVVPRSPAGEPDPVGQTAWQAGAGADIRRGSTLQATARGGAVVSMSDAQAPRAVAGKPASGRPATSPVNAGSAVLRSSVAQPRSAVAAATEAGIEPTGLPAGFVSPSPLVPTPEAGLELGPLSGDAGTGRSPLQQAEQKAVDLSSEKVGQASEPSRGYDGPARGLQATDASPLALGRIDSHGPTPQIEAAVAAEAVPVAEWSRALEVAEVADTVKQYLIERLARALQRGDKHLTLELNPPSLGQVQAQIDFSQEQLAVCFWVKSTEAHQMVSQALPDLRQALQSQGVSVGQCTVEMSTEGMPGGYQGDTGRPVWSPAAQAVATSHSHSVGTEVAAVHVGSRQGLLDVTV